MIVLDHNIPLDQAAQLRRWRIRTKQIGVEVGRPEWQDQEEVLRYLQANKRTTLFTRDLGFFNARFCHRHYCIVVIDGPVAQIATDIRWLLRSRRFRTHAQRSGCVIKILPEKMLWRRVGQPGRRSMVKSSRT